MLIKIPFYEVFNHYFTIPQGMDIKKFDIVGKNFEIILAEDYNIEAKFVNTDIENSLFEYQIATN